LEQQLTRLVEQLKRAFGERLVSVTLYGSAAVGDWIEKLSDFNVLCVLTQVSSRELGESEPIFRAWREAGSPPPLLMTRDEALTSSDCFPMEFHDMQAHRRVLHGEDVIALVEVDRSYYRAQVEHELRAKQLRLRQKAAEVLGKPDFLTRLLADSLSTFCVLGRHALILKGREPRWKKREVIADLEKVLGIRFDGFYAVLGVRADGKLPPDSSAVLLFEKYLREVDALVRFVDQLDK
jgi:predicted nucleotidyltransferase